MCEILLTMTEKIEVVMAEDVISDVAFTAIPVLCENLLRTELLRTSPADGLKKAISLVEERYHSQGKAAVVAALRNCFQEYESRRIAR